MLNPQFPIFASENCRAAFASVFREEVAKIFGDDIGVEPTLFPEILPGYVRKEDFKAHATNSCLERFRGSTLPWIRYPDGVNDLYNSAMNQAAERVGLKLSMVDSLPSLPQHEVAFASNKSAFLFFGTGFWPLDPVGDIRMLLSPGMHSGLRFVADDPNMQDFLERLGQEADSQKIKTILLEINRYTYQKALLNPVAHFRRFFVSSGSETLREVPLAVQAPYAWQAFKVQ